MNCNDCFNKTKKHLTERKDFSKQIKELMKNFMLFAIASHAEFMSKRNK